MVFAQAVTIGKMVYFGSGTTTIGEAPTDCPFKIFRYNSSNDKWSPIGGCPVVGFGMVNYMEKLTLVGGAYESAENTSNSQFALTGDVHVFDEESKEWIQTFPAMPTARLLPTVIQYGSAIVSCGGIVLDETHDICVSTVEIFDGETLQWYRAEPLPLACSGMTCAIIQESCYFLGGFTDTDFDHPTVMLFSASLPRLFEDAVAKHGLLNGSQDSESIWYTSCDAPRYAATAANIGGCLLALGGSDEKLEHKSGALHVYSPLTDSWLRIDDIPVECFSCTVAKLPRGELMIMGGMGHNEDEALKTVYRGRICVD